MTESKLRLITDEVHGITMSFMDGLNSWTVSEVFEELRNNPYGIDDANLSKDDILIDVGGNIGMFSIYAHIKYGCKIIAFEPIKENLDNFKRNILINNLNIDYFELHNSAISSEEGTFIKLGKFEHNSGGSSQFYNYVSNYEVCKTETLHKYINDKTKFLKLDCEGSEYEIIPSIMDKLNNFKYIGIEYHNVNEKTPYELHEKIKDVFKGKLFPEKIGRLVNINSYYI
jgi:FkbM family methyltransferase